MRLCGGGSGRDSPRSKTERRLTESLEKSEAVHSLTSSEGTPPFLFVGLRTGVLFGEALEATQRLYTEAINWPLCQVFSTDTLPDATASSFSTCHRPDATGRHMRKHEREQHRTHRQSARGQGTFALESEKVPSSFVLDVLFVLETVETRAPAILAPYSTPVRSAE